MTCITAFKDTFRGSFPASSLDSLLRRASSRWFPEKIGIVNYVIKCTVINSTCRCRVHIWWELVLAISGSPQGLSLYTSAPSLRLGQTRGNTSGDSWIHRICCSTSRWFPHLREQKSMNVCVCECVFVAFKSWSHGESPCFRWFQAINPSPKTAKIYPLVI